MGSIDALCSKVIFKLKSFKVLLPCEPTILYNYNTLLLINVYLGRTFLACSARSLNAQSQYGVESKSLPRIPRCSDTLSLNDVTNIF